MTKATVKPREWGGAWTETKTQIVHDYVCSYLRALQNQPFKKIYVDAFAGEGHRILARIPGLIFKERYEVFKGSPKLVLEASSEARRPFDSFIFCETDPKRAEKLLALKTEFPQFSHSIEIREMEANAFLLNFCHSTDWKSTRALVFLDPFGMQVEWPTMEALAATRAADIWVLFPLGVSVMRLLKKRGEISEGAKERLDRLFGNREWLDRFYKIHKPKFQGLLYQENDELVRCVGVRQVAEYFVERLRTVFPENGVVDPLFLFNSKNVPIYMLCFACGNQKGVPIATKIANHLIRGH
jgi:three-Cys-motif partner protein